MWGTREKEKSRIILARLRKTIRQSGTVDFVGQISSVCKTC